MPYVQRAVSGYAKGSILQIRRESNFSAFFFYGEMHIPVDKEYDLKKAWTTKEKGYQYG